MIIIKIIPFFLFSDLSPFNNGARSEQALIEVGESLTLAQSSCGLYGATT